MGAIRKVTRNVKRWRPSDMARRWVSDGVENARAHFHRIKGHKSLPVLVASLRDYSKTLDAQEQASSQS